MRGTDWSLGIRCHRSWGFKISLGKVAEDLMAYTEAIGTVGRFEGLGRIIDGA
jgi:hypothetical protein